MDVWVEQEIAECAFPDQRLKTRLGQLLSRLGQKIGATLPTACQDWAATKAGYRFLSHPRVDESIILAGHFAATRSRMAAAKGPLLILHDTTEFTFQRDKPETIGKTKVLASRSRRTSITLCALGRKTESVATQLVILILRQLSLPTRLLLVIDDSPTRRYGPHVEGADIHRNPTPGPSDRMYLYGHIWVTLSLALRHPQWGAMGLRTPTACTIRPTTMTDYYSGSRAS